MNKSEIPVPTSENPLIQRGLEIQSLSKPEGVSNEAFQVATAHFQALSMVDLVIQNPDIAAADVAYLAAQISGAISDGILPPEAETIFNSITGTGNTNESNPDTGEIK